MHYTPAQTRWFLQAIDRDERERAAASAIGMRMSEADAKGFKGYLEGLLAWPCEGDK